MLGKNMISCFKAKRDDESDQSQNFFLENGGALLQELIVLCNGRSNPIHHFSSKELLKATNNYEHQLFTKKLEYCKMYKGSLKDRPIVVKKYNYFHGAAACKDIAIGSRMSAHKNVLKVLGCCLETQEPIIVYEFGGTKLLSKCNYATNVEPLPWKCKLKIARDLASAFAYLHTAFPRPIIHRNIDPNNIILDENNVPKLTDFGFCKSIPKGESHVRDDICGTKGYIAPEYFVQGCCISEKADVYSFGILLLHLLIGEKAYGFCMKHNIEWDKYEDLSSRVVDHYMILTKKENIEKEQLLDFRTLVVRCTSSDEEQRPTMIEVGQELRKMYQSFQLVHY